jgi:CRP/FNR family cyclic AMP-dependent transcriptional regulator
MTSEQKHPLFARHPLFGALSPAEIDRIVAQGRIVSYDRSAVIFREGEAGRGLLAVLRGTVKISSLSKDGREIILNLIGEGEVFGEIALLDGRPRTADAVAQTRCELFCLDRRDFLPILRGSADLSLRLMEVLCRRLRRTSEQAEDLMFLDLPSRLAKTLLRLAKPHRSSAVPQVRATQRELAVLIGMTRESTNRQLRAWVRGGWIELDQGAILIRDPGALGRFAEGGTEGRREEAGRAWASGHG